LAGVGRWAWYDGYQIKNEWYLMAFNIKNEETIQIAREIAERTGESIAAVFDGAVRDRRKRMEDEREAKVQRILRLTSEMRARMSPETLALDHGELLYDEKGMPK
jgi:antitoxin VapB